jgi:6-phosphogluconate dehydrogenase
MSAKQCDIGLIGLAVMGENLVLNMESKGFSVAVLNRTVEVTEKFASGKANGKNIVPTRSVEEFVAALSRPRRAMIMVKAGAPVDAVIAQLTPLLEKGDVIVDGGNSPLHRHQQPAKELEGAGLHFVGWESRRREGALKGPSLMPGGRASHGRIVSARIFPQIAAQSMASPAAVTWGPERRRPLREDGAQRHRIRRHAAHLRVLRRS